MTVPSGRISYRFNLSGGVRDVVDLDFSDQGDLLADPDLVAPDWARLDFHTCQECPLAGQGIALCPFAAGLARFIQRFETRYSYERAVVEAITPRRTVVAEVALQAGIASVLGLVGATCGCPRLAFLKPMARFHLPFSSEQETLIRVFSFYLLGRHLADKDQTFNDLSQSYAQAALVNRGMADRIRAAFTKDAVVNAIVILDAFAQAVPFVIDEKLDELKPLFNA